MHCISLQVLLILLVGTAIFECGVFRLCHMPDFISFRVKMPELRWGEGSCEGHKKMQA